MVFLLVFLAISAVIIDASPISENDLLLDPNDGISKIADQEYQNTIKKKGGGAGKGGGGGGKKCG